MTRAPINLSPPTSWKLVSASFAEIVFASRLPYCLTTFDFAVQRLTKTRTLHMMTTLLTQWTKSRARRLPLDKKIKLGGVGDHPHRNMLNDYKIIL
ncbi:hypothetical protein TYRP_018259 [Tyrophagus putrescentiae]|nr:hypothetical protein TYRP_018259 [Tyrophagus putrescentiae]